MKTTIIFHDIEGVQHLCIPVPELALLKRSKAFKPPTIEEVREYCKERKNGIDPQSFIDYYQTRGWYCNKGVKMKDFESAVRTWEKNKKTDPKQGTLPASKGTNLSSGKLRKDYGKPSETAGPMPEAMRKRMLNIGNTD